MRFTLMQKLLTLPDFHDLIATIIRYDNGDVAPAILSPPLSSRNLPFLSQYNL